MLTEEEEEAFTESSTGTSFSALGQAVINELLNKENGRRILIDIGGMSLKSREWYYKQIKTIPFFI